jgi:hypothetical protein
VTLSQPSPLTRLRSREDELATARDEFRDALRAAHAAGVPFAVLGRLVGLSRQRVARIVADG